MWQRLRKSKVFWTSVAAVLYCISSAVSGDMAWAEAIRGIWAALLAIGFRDTLVAK